MSLAIVHTRSVSGIEAHPVTIEVYLSRGLPGLHIVGMPQTAVRESKDRVRSAILTSGFRFPVAKIIVNLAPADLPKGGGCFDLPIALGILAASDQIPKTKLDDYEFAAELALTGELRPIKAALPLAIATTQEGRKLILPTANAKEASLIEDAQLFPAVSLTDVCAHILGSDILAAYQNHQTKPALQHYSDMREVIGQPRAKRSLEVAAAGGHSLFFIGPPGAGKTMLASRLPGILPPMTEAESLEVAAVYSISQKGFSSNQWGIRPFQAPHHTASAAALAGGGNPPKPGEVSMAHCGVLFLDELPEFNRHALEVLREPIESGEVSISRAAHQAKFPARVQLVAAMNPCPCGYFGDQIRSCYCTADQIQRYQSRISGPLLDRFDMHVAVAALSKKLLINKKDLPNESSSDIRQRVQAARNLQIQRSQKSNALLNNQEIEALCCFSAQDQQFLENSVTQLGLSARAYYRILRLSRTIADLAQSEQILQEHLQEAISYRKLNVYAHQ